MQKHLSTLTATLTATLFATLTIAVFLSAFSLQPFSPSAAAAPGDGIELGLQAYTFRNLTLAETLDRAAAMNIKNIQAYRGQKISPATDEKFGHTMSAAAKTEVRALFAARALTLASYGVVTGKDEADWRQIFDFAKEMHIPEIALEPRPGHMPLVAKLSAETGIKTALHNHPPPTLYADPETALAAIAPYGPDAALCADTGHWARAGHDPVAALRKAAGRIHSLHFKDLSETGVKTAHDMPWGTGATNAALQLLELRRQHFQGILYMEYEHDLPQPQLDAQTAASAEWFHRAAAASDDDLLAGRVLPPGHTTAHDITQKLTTTATHPPGAAAPHSTLSILHSTLGGEAAALWPAPLPLFAPDLTNAQMKPGAWQCNNGILTSTGNGNIWTTESYSDFALNLEFRCDEKTDTGVLLRCPDPADWEHNTIEIQILQGDAPKATELAGAILDIAAPSRQVDIEPGKWHRLTIIAQAQRIQVYLDGERVTNARLSRWTQPGQNPDGTPNKFKKALADAAPQGRIGLQAHKTAAFRNIVIEPIAP